MRYDFSAYKHILSYYFLMSSETIFVKNSGFWYKTDAVKGDVLQKNGKNHTFMQVNDF